MLVYMTFLNYIDFWKCKKGKGEDKFYKVEEKLAEIF